MTFLNDITTVTVNYNSRAVIDGALRPLVGTHEMLIVDNASSDDSVSYIQTMFPAARIIRNDQNLGFGAGVNAAIPYVTTPYILLITPDVLIDVSRLRELYDQLICYNDAAFVAPVLRVPRRGIETWVMGPNEFRQQNARVQSDGPFCTWFASVALCLWRTDAMRALGGFDAKIFLYQEDLDLCLRTRHAGYSIVIDPHVVVDHINSGSAPRSRRLHWRKDWNFAWSHLYVTGKHIGRKASLLAAWQMIASRAPKVLLYALTIDIKRFIRDFATMHGAICYLLGRFPSRPQ
jgi:N-acetylglucosaminyl-diphospho-decaprenol L-rhamnosyltransferase